VRVDDENGVMLQQFLAESEENFGAIEECLVALEHDPGDEAHVQEIFRHAHTFKGNASCLAFDEIAELAHVFEELLHQVRDHRLAVTPDLISLLLAGKDALRDLVARMTAGKQGFTKHHHEVMARLVQRAHVRGQPPGSTPVPSPAQEPARPPAHEPGAPAITAAASEQEALQLAAERIQATTLRVETARLDRMLGLITEMTVARGRLEQMLVHTTRDRGVIDAFHDVDPLFAELQEQVLKVRMVPLGPVFRRYIRAVRDLAEGQGKRAHLVLGGADVEVDVSVAEHLGDALTHLVRNAIDHGIERPEARLARGKPASGEIALRARRDKDSIVIELSDDGAGLDRAKLVERALARGHAGAQNMSDGEAFDLVFEPGISTADSVTTLSGRGVGMDVVRRKLEALRGTVSIDSRRGASTSVTIRLPLNVAIIQGFAVAVGGETFVIPLETVVECLELPASGDTHADGQRGMFNLRGAALPFLRLRELFAMDPDPRARENLVVVEHENRRVGLSVDSILGEMRAVIKPLGKLFHGLEGVSAATILASGRVALVLDVPGLLRGVVQPGANTNS
jgi:two-component system chemotaxis sensor kinase CheA